MPKFKLTSLKVDTGALKDFYYSTEDSSLTDEFGAPVGPERFAGAEHEAQPVSPLGKGGIKTLKIQLGLSCNYECEYCSQRFVPRSDETNPSNVEPFMAGLDQWVKSPPDAIEFWGGEPLVYIKTLKPLAEELRKKFPSTALSIITNGSLLNAETNAWLDDMGFTVGISHDGPGQFVRGPDPLDEPEKRAAILDLYKTLSPKGRISFNAMMNRNNASRSAVQKFFIELTGDENVSIGEGGIVDSYDTGGVENSLRQEELIPYRNLALTELKTDGAKNFSNVSMKMIGFAKSILSSRPITSVGQKCSMDRSDNIAVDLNGNVLTCQNVSAVSVAPNGQSHKIGHVSDLASVELKSSTHWSNRSECPSCPMIHICAGSCMFLDGPLWDVSCDNAFSDAVPIFAAVMEHLTGYVPIHIEGPHRESRKDIFGLINGAPASSKKPFPIPVVAG